MSLRVACMPGVRVLTLPRRAARARSAIAVELLRNPDDHHDDAVIISYEVYTSVI